MSSPAPTHLRTRRRREHSTAPTEGSHGPVAKKRTITHTHLHQHPNQHSTAPTEGGRGPVATRRKITHTHQHQHQDQHPHQHPQQHHHPPRFWDTLSKVRLTRRALYEFDRRCKPKVSVPAAEQEQTSRTRRLLLRSDYRRLKQLASGGGPDLSTLRGYSSISAASLTMNQSSSRGRKRSRPSGVLKTTTPYSGDFQQKLVDRGIYPEDYQPLGGNQPPKPDNVEEIQRILAQPRASLSPSKFTETAFQEFHGANRQCTSESKVITQVIPVIVGSQDKDHMSATDVSFTCLKLFDPELSIPKPDLYYGAQPSQIELRVRDALAEYIVPSGRSNLPAAPNFLFECKGPSGRVDVAQNQAMYDSAIGARGILQLQNYGQPIQTYDGNAYTISSIYHSGTGLLEISATHPRPAENVEDAPRDIRYETSEG